MVMAVCTLTLGVGFYIALNNDMNFLEKDYKELTSIEAKLIGEFSISPLIKGNSKGADEILKKASTSIEEFKSIEVYNENGDLFTQHGTVDIQPPNHIRLIKDTAIYYREQHELKVSHVITSEGHLFGFIIIHVYTNNLEQQIWEDKKSLLIAAIIIILTGGIITFFAQKAVSNPISKLAKYINHIATDNNITKTIRTTRNDEIGQIYKAINKLISTIKSHADERDEFFAEIQKNNSKLGHTLESFSDGYWEYNLLTNKWFFSDRWLETFGYKQESIKKDNKSFLNMIHPEDLDIYNNALENHLKGVSTFFEAEFRLLGKKGGYSWVSFKGKWIERQNKSITHVLGITNNIQEKIENASELMDTNERLIQEKKLTALNHMISGISHSLKNLLNPIFGYADFGIQTTKNRLLKDELNLIKDSAQSADNLIEDLLDSSSDLRLEKEHVDLIPIIKKAGLRVNENFKSIDLVTETSLKQAIVLGNSSKLEKAIFNVLENAFISSPSDNKVTVKIDYYSKDYHDTELNSYHEITNGEYVRIEILDKGAGIEESNLNTIFEPFHTTRAVGEGIGLGLSSTKGIITSHNGFIFISSILYKETSCVLLIPVLK